MTPPIALERAAKRILRLALLCIGACAFSGASAGLNVDSRISQYGHSVWRIQDGYLSSMPEAITQTTDGYLWIGTYTGLFRFDGVRFVPFSSLDGKTLPDSRIFSVLGAKDGGLWIGTGAGLARYKDGVLTIFREPHGRINKMVEDHDGNIWMVRSSFYDEVGPLCRMQGMDTRCFGKEDGIELTTATRLALDDEGYFWVAGQMGICRWKPGSTTTYFKDELAKRGLLMGVLAIDVERGGDVWASVEGEKGALELRHFSEGKWKKYNLPDLKGPDPGITALLTDRDGVLWIGTAKRGIYRLHDGKADHYSTADGLSSDGVVRFFQDHEGTLWIATSKGLDSFRDLPVITYSMHEGLTADSVSTVSAGRSGTVWIGNSGGLDILRNGKLSAIRTAEGLPGREVTTSFEDHQGRLWLGLDKSFYMYDGAKFREIRKPDGSSTGSVFGITEDTDGNIWARAGKKLICIQGLNIVKEIGSFETEESSAIAADPKKGIWLGYANGNLAHSHDDHLEQFPAEPQVSTAKIRQVIPESDHSVWGVTEKGLVWWHDGKHDLLTAKNGLPCNELYTAVKDDAGTSWFYTRCGLLGIDNSEIKKWQQDTSTLVAVRLLDVFDGVQASITPLQPQSARSADGRLWFANDIFLQFFSPKKFTTNKVAPNVVVEHITADGKEHPARDNIRLPALTRNLQIDYTALSFLAPQKIRFRYKLDGRDTDWQDPHTRRQAFYDDLSPGNYTFRVIACNNDGVWNETGATLEFSVAPAFYQTAWFAAVCLGAFVVLLLVLYQFRVRQVAAAIRARMEERLGERERIARELHDTFLQSVQGLILRFHAVTKQIPVHEPARETMEKALDRADSVLSEGRDRVRNLRYNAAATSSLPSTIRSVAEEHAQGTKTEFRVLLEGTERQLHPMVLEEANSIACEATINAFRHAEALHIEVEIIYDSKQLRLRIRDDGRGIAPAILETGGRAGHWGLQGMRERARKIGAQLDFWSRPGSGTEVELRIPSATAYRTPGAGAGWRWFRAFLPTNGKR